MRALEGSTCVLDSKIIMETIKLVESGSYESPDDFFRSYHPHFKPKL